jgi:hypothetical protein
MPGKLLSSDRSSVATEGLGVFVVLARADNQETCRTVTVCSASRLKWRPLMARIGPEKEGPFVARCRDGAVTQPSHSELGWA